MTFCMLFLQKLFCMSFDSGRLFLNSLCFFSVSCSFTLTFSFFSIRSWRAFLCLIVHSSYSSSFFAFLYFSSLSLLILPSITLFLIEQPDLAGDLTPFENQGNLILKLHNDYIITHTHLVQPF